MSISATAVDAVLKRPSRGAPAISMEAPCTLRTLPPVKPPPSSVMKLSHQSRPSNDDCTKQPCHVPVAPPLNRAVQGVSVKPSLPPPSRTIPAGPIPPAPFKGNGDEVHPTIANTRSTSRRTSFSSDGLDDATKRRLIHAIDSAKCANDSS